MEKSNRKNQRTKRNIIVSAVLAILLCIGIIVGATVALFTSEDKINVSVNSGNVEIEATVEDFTLYSPTSISMGEGNAVENAENAATQKTTESAGVFANGGTADVTIGEDDSELLLKLDKMTPGDKVTFKLVLTNKSNVKTKYRMSVSNATDDSTLFDVLDLNIVGITSAGSSIWKELAAVTDIENGVVIGSYDCYVELPTTVGNDYKGLSCTIAFKVEQVQGNAKATDDVTASMGASTATVSVKDKQTTATETNVATTSEDVSLSSIDSVAVTEANGETKVIPVVSAVVPTGATLDNGATELTLTIYETANPANFTVAVADTQTTRTLEVKMEGLSSDNETALTIEMYVGKNLEGFALYHNGEAMNPETSVADVQEDQDYYYDSNTGIVTMKSSKFSPFTAVYTTPVDGLIWNAAQNRYEISNVNGLKVFRDKINKGKKEVVDGDKTKNVCYLDNIVIDKTEIMNTVVLTADIDLNNELWTPINLSPVIYDNSGFTFDGQNHTISNIKVVTTDGKASGLFGYCYFTGSAYTSADGLPGFRIYNLTIANASITKTMSGGGQYGAAALVGQATSVYLENVHAKGSISVTSDGAYDIGVATLTGYTGGRVIANNCSVKAANGSKIDAADYGEHVGGIFGVVALDGAGNITECTVSGISVSGNHCVGGIAGYINGDSANNENAGISNCTVGEGVSVSGQGGVAALVGQWKAVPDYVGTGNTIAEGTTVNNAKTWNG